MSRSTYDFPLAGNSTGRGSTTPSNTPATTRKKGRPDRALRLVKAIYGLKQSGALWEETLRSFLLSIGAVQCAVDPCLWRYSKDGNTLLFVVYVDDIVIACSNQDFRDAFVSMLQESDSHCATMAHSPGCSVLPSSRT